MDDDHTGELRFRTIWISDLHLGSTACRAPLLLDFLRHTESKHLYLVGDIVDGWQLRRRWFWPQSHNDVVQKILRKARKGTSVVYIPGNHDAFGRHFAALSFGGIELREEAVHSTADGRRLLVVHGDLFDGVIQCAKWLAFVGDRLYLLTLELNRWFNAVRARLGFPYWSLSQFLKHKVKNAVSYITDFESALAQEARRRGVDTELFRPGARLERDWPRPVFMYVGRVAIEKNIGAFLALDLPGTKVVVGDGPQREALERRFPSVVFTGAKMGEELAAHFRSADAFVFPSRTDTFGLVLLEAMASGIPAAAFPVAGPIDVIDSGRSGMLSEDLRAAALAALELDRDGVRRHALAFSWERATAQFLANLHPNHAHA